ncbi:MAG TPA: hypothetical protein VJV77_02075 [Casimicrobiaceae bacterium]|nr:hypothetical protein [Casimicrobiaceae bacterium]
MNAETTCGQIVPAHASGEQRNIPHLRGQVNREPPIGTPGHDLCVTGRCTDAAQPRQQTGGRGVAKITKRAKGICGSVDYPASFVTLNVSSTRRESISRASVFPALRNDQCGFREAVP